MDFGNRGTLTNCCITCGVVVASTQRRASSVVAQEQLLDCLYGKTGRNRLTLCADEGVECEGALWKSQWIVTYSSCLQGVPLYQVAVMEGSEGCENYVQEIVRNTARTVRIRFPHPDPEQNIDLLFLDIPFSEVEQLANTTMAHELFKEYDPWMQRTIRSYQPDVSYVNSYARRTGAYSSPVRMFVTTVVLPSAAFILFFLFVVLFTSPQRNYVVKESNVPLRPMNLV